MTTRYSFDAGALITAHRFHYPYETFPSLWRKLESTISAGHVFLCQETFNEITPNDWLHSWAREQRQKNPSFVQRTTSDIARIMAEISKEHRSLTEHRNARPGDPFIIAHAKHAGAIVVTEERKSGGPEAEKIPNVCARRGVPCINFLGFMQAQKYRF